LLADQDAPTALRFAAIHGLSIWESNAFDFKNPDKRLNRMFDTYIDLLTDKSRDMRIQAPPMLFDRALAVMADQTPPDLAQAYARKAVQALVKAMSVETDEQVLIGLKSRAWQYENAGNNLMDQFRKSATNEIQ
jgi:hypothetical protein